MKLINKLIPLTTVSSVAAIVAPIALTSCSYTLEGKVFDCTKIYTPSIKQAEEDVMDIYKLIDTYTKAVVDNKQILIEDLMWSASNFGNTFDPYFFISPILSNWTDDTGWAYRLLAAAPSNDKYSHDMKKVDNINVSSKLVTTTDGDQINTLLLSLDIQYSMELSPFTLRALDDLLEDDGYFVKNKFDATLEGILHLNNVPCIMYTDGLFDITTFQPTDYPHLIALMDWMIGGEHYVEECGKWSIDLDQTMTLSNAGNVEYCPTTLAISSDYKLNKENCVQENICEWNLLRLMNYSLFCSYYLGKIVVVE